LRNQLIPQDYGGAAKWLRKAAGQIDIDWDRDSAEKGYVVSLYFLGLRYFIGEGVPQNYSESLFWLELVTTATGNERHLAGSHGISDSPVIAKLSSMAASHLDQTEVKQVEERARKWIKEHPTRYE
jgi:TPR repeat protein